jgi:hypothetical protein
MRGFLRRLTHALEQVTANFNRLESEIETRADPELSATAASTRQAIKQITSANTELRDTLIRITPITAERLVRLSASIARFENETLTAIAALLIIPDHPYEIAILGRP